MELSIDCYNYRQTDMYNYQQTDRAINRQQDDHPARLIELDDV